MAADNICHENQENWPRTNPRDQFQDIKQDVRKRGLASANNPDALAVIFAYSVKPSHQSGGPEIVRQ